jgi:hypothetical protein
MDLVTADRQIEVEYWRYLPDGSAKFLLRWRSSSFGQQLGKPASLAADASE